MSAAEILIETYRRRGYLSAGKYISAIGVARDLEIVALGWSRDPIALIEARSRLGKVEATLTQEQMEIVRAFVNDDNPSTWAKLNGLAHREGLPKLRTALARLVSIYVEDGTE